MRTSLGRTLAAGACTALLGLQTACHTWQPVQPLPAPRGERAGLVLNDAGRVAVAGLVGPATARLDGTIVGERADSVVVSVLGVRDLSGAGVRWSGEAVVVPVAGIAGWQPRAVSRSRTAFLLGALTLGLAVLVGQSLDVGRGDSRTPPPQRPPGAS